MATAEKMCDRIFMIFKGKKVLDGTLDEIQAQYGFDTVRVRTAAGAAACQGLSCVQAVNDYGQLQEVRVSGNPQQFLQQLAARTDVHHFEITRPSLHDIFVRIARPADARTGEPGMNKAMIVAVSEFTTLVRSKAFIIGLLMMPVFMAIALGVQKFTQERDRRQGPRLRRRRSDRRAVRAAEGGGRRLEPRREGRAATQMAPLLPAVGGDVRRGGRPGAGRAVGPRQARRALRVRRDPEGRARSRVDVRDPLLLESSRLSPAADVDRDHREPRDHDASLPRGGDRPRAGHQADQARGHGGAGPAPARRRRRDQGRGAGGQDPHGRRSPWG